MLSIQPSTPSPKTTPSLLPCKIHHNGPIPTSKRYWSPKPSTTNKSTTTTTTTTTPDNAQDNETVQTSYFRGRKLQGLSLSLPEGYTGKILQKTDEAVSRAPERRSEEDGEEEEEEEEEEVVEVKTLREIGHFDEIVVWGHEEVPDRELDEYIKGLKEWVGFAEAMHSWDAPKTAS